MRHDSCVVRSRLALSIFGLVALLILVVWYFQARRRATESSITRSQTTESSISDAARGPTPSSDSGPTSVHAHNLMLRKGPSFRIYVRWLRGQLVRTRSSVNPSFDDPDSFSIYIKTGVIRANIGDISNYLNASGIANSPLKNVSLSGDGDQIKLKGTVHKVIPIPIELDGTIEAMPDSRIHIHVTKLDVLKVPLGGFHIKISDVFHPANVDGLELSGNDILLDTQKLLPAPHIRGQLTKVRVVNPDLEEIYGDARTDVERVQQWRNFLQLRGGTIDFGKLTMHHVDLIMIDISKDPWFNLDLANYQAQLVNGYTRMTPQAGMQIFMPDLREIPHDKANQNISIEWYKNRNIPPPSDVTSK